MDGRGEKRMRATAPSFPIRCGAPPPVAAVAAAASGSSRQANEPGPGGCAPLRWEAGLLYGGGELVFKFLYIYIYAEIFIIKINQHFNLQMLKNYFAHGVKIMYVIPRMS